MDSPCSPTSSVAVRRLRTTLSHISPSEGEDVYGISHSDCAAHSVSTRDHTEEDCKWNGWGYKDSYFDLDEDGQFYLTGDRYELSGQVFPHFRDWAERVVGLDTSHACKPNYEPPDFPEPLLNQDFLNDIRGHYSRLSQQTASRLFHAHGHTCRDIFRLRHGTFERVPDVVIWPGKHEHVEVIVKAATKHNVCIIPFGGGTSVTLALECPENEKRMIVSLDMKEMNRIKWIDRSSFLACIETGVVGKDLEEKLAVHGLTMGHEPDSIEFSTLGGWISTRASGMKKNIYGNIEDILVKARLVTPTGTIEKSCEVPRMSAGPDVNQIILGSEGMFGVITEAVVRLRPIPEVKVYGSVVFPDWDSGVAFMQEIAKRRWAPSSIRLMDNLQFQFGQALKPAQTSKVGAVLDAAKKLYITKYHGFDVNSMCACTMVFEGDKEAVAEQERRYGRKHNFLLFFPSSLLLLFACKVLRLPLFF
jgi:alkyldihydroxyacetonephosphate synthase